MAKMIKTEDITRVVSELCIKACNVVSADIRDAMLKFIKTEPDIGKSVLTEMLKNQDIAAEKNIPICQDTGMVVVFVTIGNEIRIDGDITTAINEGVRLGYTDGYLRKSVVKDPFDRINTGDNTPAVIHFMYVTGDSLEIVVAPKGFGSENMSRVKMLVPAEGLSGVKSFILETVKLAGPNACPPIIVGVGVGGTLEYSALMAKKALIRKVGTKNQDEFLDKLEADLLEEINNTGIGPSGFGGKTTALAVHINTFATHIAGLPVTVNLACHANRHESVIF